MLDGIAWAAEKLGVPIVGGHLTLGHAPALSALLHRLHEDPAAGVATRDRATSLVAAFATDGRWMSDAQRS